MDSLPGEDPTLPLEFNGSVNISRLPDVSGDEIHVHLGGGGALPDVAEDAISPTRVRTMKDFENQITELRKENFNLKLRIYFLEERIQQKFDGPNEDIYRINIELKVELESLKRELQEREQLLIKASKAVESLAQGGDAEIQHLKEEARRQVSHVEESLTSRIHLLEEELKSVQRELEEAFAVTERERALRLATEQQLCLTPSMQSKDLDVMTALEEKDRHIEQLSLALQNKEALIQRLEKAKAHSESPEETLSAEKIQDDTASLLHEKERELEALRTELRNGKNDFEKRIQSLQEELLERERELSAEKRNALKRDKTIQGLTLALKTKETENEELSSEIEKLNASLTKAREATHKVQMQKFKGAEDYQALLAEKENLLIELRSENLNKDTENRKLQRKIKRTDQELKDLHLERDKLMKELDEAQLQKSRSDKMINDLRNQLEKIHSEMDEREKAAERHYRVLLSESNQKLQSQELVIAHLTDGTAQKDQLVQQLEGAIREKDAELQEWLAKFQGVLKEKDALERRNEDSVEEKGAARSPQPAIDTIRDLEKTKASEYADLTKALQRERDAFSRLLTSLEDADGINMNNLREEVNNIILLRKQLEEDISTNWDLRKVLEDQIKANRKEVEESISSWGDQTSYMSICLRDHDHLSLQLDHLSLEELKKKVLELLSVVKELHSVNQDLRQKHLESSKLESLAKESLTALDQSEFLERTEESVTLTEGFDEEMSASSGQPSESSNKQVIPSDSLDRQCKNPNEPRSGGSTPGPSCEAQEKSLLVSLSNASGAALESRKEQMKIVNQLLDHPHTAQRDGSSDDLEHKDEKDLKQLIIQLRAELKRLAQGNHFVKQQGELQATLAENETALDPDPALQTNAGTEASKVDVRDTASQTVMVEGSIARQKHGGKVGASEEKGRDARFHEDWERRQERGCPTSEQQEAVLRTRRTNKSDSACPFKKSRLPVPLKSSKSLGSVLLSTRAQKPDMHLQHRIFTLDEDLKGKPVQPQLLSDDSQLSKTESGTSEQVAELAAAEPSIKMDATEGDVSVVSSDTKDGMSKDQSKSRETEANECEPTLSALETPNEDFDYLNKQDIDSATTYSGSKSLLSLKLSITSTEAFDSEMADDVEELRQTIKDLKAELAKYRANQAPPPAQPLPPRDALPTAHNSGVLPMDGSFVSVLDTNRHQTTTFSDTPQQADYQICVENMTSYVSEKQNEETVEKLKELLSENEAELEKEQIANMHLLDEVCRLQTKLQGTSLSRSNSPIFTPVHELSWQRQKIQESHSVCVAYRQHLTNLIKAFEELLQASEVDYYVAEGFREQLSQSVQLFERLEKQCLYGESLDDEITQLCGLVQSVSSLEMSEKLHALESPKQREGGVEEGEREKLTAMLAKFPPELLMEHLQEIRMLRHHLEESIQTNERLRKQLEQQVAGSAQDPGSANVCIHGSEQHNSLTSEIHFLRKQNQALNVMLAKGSRDKQKENEKLRESLSKKQLAIEQLHKDYERIQTENEKLQKQVGKREEENGHLTHEVYSIRNQLNRLQMELNAKQHQLSENDKLLHSLRLELKVYEKLDEALGSQKDRSHNGSEECWKDKNCQLDLHELLTEIQKLRTQLERSIKANKGLHEKLEEQLSREKGSSGSTVNINYLFKRESQHYDEFKFPTADSNILELQQKYRCLTPPLQGDAELALDGTDISSRCSSSASKSRDPCAVPGHCVWADKNGRHILGSVEDYNSLRKQISEGWMLLSELELHLKEVECQEPGEKVPHQASLSRLSATICAVQQNLEEAARLLKLFWRVSLPMKVVHSAAYSLQDEGLTAELHKLRRKLAEQERKLQSTAKRLHFTSQLKENMEQVIISQLALTHDVLKKARGNLEVQPAENKTAAFSLSEKRVL